MKTMLSLVITLLVLGLVNISHGAAVNTASQDVSIELQIPRGQSRAEFEQSIIDYWTPERMAAAQPVRPVIVDKSDLYHFTNYRTDYGPEKILTRSDVVSATRSTVPTVAGKVYFVMNGQNYLCSGSVVNATNQDTVITAGHCVFDYERQIWASNWIFVPQYSIGSRPFGTFTWRRMATKQGWMDNRDFNYDVAIVLMNRNDKGRRIQEVTGGLGLTLNPPRGAVTNAFGYPKNINSGETMSTCVATSLSPTFVSGFTGLQLFCGMTGGASGGPWIQQYNTDTLSGQQVSVNSFIISNRPNNMFGPYFNEDNIGSLYRTYQDQ